MYVLDHLERSPTALLTSRRECPNGTVPRGSFRPVLHHYPRALVQRDLILGPALDCSPIGSDRHAADPLEVGKATLASIVAKASPGIRFNEHMEGNGETVFRHACKLGPRRHRVEAQGLPLPFRPLT
jgi:hypothetical protein